MARERFEAVPERAPARDVRRRLGRLIAPVFIALLAIGFGILLGQRFEPAVADLVLAFQAPAPSERVVIVEVDEDTVAQLPARSPIDRTFLAELVAALDAKGPAVIGLDLLFTRPTLPEKDAALVSAIGAAQNPVILAFGDTSDGLTEEQAAYAEGFFGEKGRATLLRDRADGTVRALPDDGTPAPLALAMARAAGEDVTMPTGRIVYSDGTFPSYPAHFAGRLPADWFADKFVLVGTKLKGLDRHRTPRIAMVGADQAQVPGVVVHAHILSQLLAGTRRAELPDWALGLSAVLAAIAGLSLRPLAPLVAAGAALAGVVAYLALSVLVTFQTPATQPFVTPVFAFLAAGAGTLGHRWRGDRRERIRLRSMFGRYVSPRVVKRLVEADREPELGGERREVSHIFTDLQGFTALAETLEPETTGEILNSYLDGIIHIVLEAEGTLDKLVGDAVVAFFGAPDRQDDHAARAVACARAIAAWTEEERARWAARGIPLGITRVGVHTGHAVVGNFGGRRFFDYTAIGDSVNVAARLESVNNLVGTRVLVSKPTRKLAEGAFRPVARMEVKGRKKPITCFEPIDAPDPAYTEAYMAMAHGEERALALFETLCAERANDALVAVHLARLRGGQRDDLITR